MREKISRLARGIFDDADPNIELSESRISLEITQGSRQKGSFRVRSADHVQIRAMVFSSNRRMTCLTPSITGDDIEVEYEFDASSCRSGDIQEGTFTLVSNGGELALPFTATICAPYVQLPGRGRIDDLDSFADFARRDWDGALAVFESDDFRRVFLGNGKARRTYDTLIKGSDPSLAMDEFLCALRRKEPVSIRVSEKQIEMADLDRTRGGELVIEKEGWGHLCVRVKTQGRGISAACRKVTGDMFLGSYYKLEYHVDPPAAREGRGAVLLETFGQNIRVPVSCSRTYARSEERERHRSAALSQIGLLRLECDYRLGNISRERWLADGMEYISGCLNKSDDEDSIFRIVEASYLDEAGRHDDAGVILDSLNERELRYRSAMEYLYYLYVNALHRHDSHYTRFVADTIRLYAQGQFRDRWEPAILLIRLERPRGSRALAAYKRIRQLYEQGHNSVFLYLEAALLARDDPSLIVEGGAFERSLFIWGVRRRAFSRELYYQFASLDVKGFYSQYARSMMKICTRYESKEMLDAVIRQLTQGACTDREYNSWYKLGIESAVRQPGLYENYMASLDLDQEADIPDSALIYFQYDNRLPADQRAYLYRYVLEQRNRYDKLFANYSGIIRAFALGQLDMGRIDRNLAAIYSYYLNGDELTGHVYQKLAPILFSCRLKIDDGISDVRRVIVDYEELDHVLSYDTDGSDVVYVNLFLDDYRILFEDAAGGRHLAAGHYSLERLMDAGRYIKGCCDQCPDDPAVLFNRSERALKYQMVDENSISVYKRTLNLGNIGTFYQRTILKNLIDYYYDTYEGETLEKYLLQIDIQMLGPEERDSIIEYYVQRGLFERAFRAVSEYGYENMRLKRVMRLCSKMIRARDFEKNDFLVDMAAYTFEGGRYDETILGYLNLYFNGPVGQLFESWKAAGDFEVPSFELEERLLCESLFTGKLLDQVGPVFASYYSRHSDMRIVRAFLASYSYRYLTGRQEAEPDVFRIMEIELDQMEAARDICSLAMIKYCAEGGAEPSDMAVDVYKEAALFIDRGIIFPFFRAFAGNGLVPAQLVDMSYVVCTDRPGRSLYALYKGSDAGWDQARKEPLAEIVGGIYVRGFRLMPGQSFSYRIFDENEENGAPIKEGAMDGDRNPFRESAGAGSLRRMVSYTAEADDQALEEELVSYDRFDEMTDRIFHLV